MRKSDLLFFLTGAAALVYESVWIRLLARLIGSDAGGLAVVLAVFMGGMGLGAALCGGLAKRSSLELSGPSILGFISGLASCRFLRRTWRSPSKTVKDPRSRP